VSKTVLTVIKLDAGLIIKLGFGAAFLGAAQLNLMIHVFGAVTWFPPCASVHCHILPVCTVNLPVCTVMVSAAPTALIRQVSNVTSSY
jgi:hypothetical protein